MMKLSDIADIAELMATHDLTEFLIESDEMKLTMKRGGRPESLVPVPAMMTGPAAAPVPAAAPIPDGGGEGSGGEPVGTGNPTIDSPIVGTFYAASSPDAPPFVKAGDKVNEETVVCIVEAMKVMNEIKAERCGVIHSVLIENASPVEFGQPLFELETS